MNLFYRSVGVLPRIWWLTRFTHFWLRLRPSWRKERKVWQLEFQSFARDNQDGEYVTRTLLNRKRQMSCVRLCFPNPHIVTNLHMAAAWSGFHVNRCCGIVVLKTSTMQVTVLSHTWGENFIPEMKRHYPDNKRSIVDFFLFGSALLWARIINSLPFDMTRFSRQLIPERASCSLSCWTHHWSWVNRSARQDSMLLELESTKSKTNSPFMQTVEKLSQKGCISQFHKGVNVDSRQNNFQVRSFPPKIILS